MMKTVLSVVEDLSVIVVFIVNPSLSRQTDREACALLALWLKLWRLSVTFLIVSCDSVRQTVGHHV